jgi:amino acid transporter
VEDVNNVQLKKSLGFWSIVGLSVTSIMGTGIFLGPAIAAKFSGPASIIAWVILSVITVYISLCFAELVALFPNAGGVYEYAKNAYGRFPSFLVGWIVWLVGNVTTSVLIIAALEFLPFSQGIKFSFAIISIVLLNVIAMVGVEASGFLLTFLAFLSLIAFVILIILGFKYVDFNNFQPFFVTSPKMIVLSVFFILETFFGWESVTFLSEETENPTKVIPKALIVSTILICIITLLFVIVALGMFDYTEYSDVNSGSFINGFKSSDLILNMGEKIFGFIGIKIIAIISFLSLIGSAAGGVVGGPRLLLALARDKLFIEQLSKIHKRFKTPHNAILFQLIVSILLIVISFTSTKSYETILSMLIPLALIMYALTLLTIPIFRYKFPDKKRDFTVPFGKIGPILVSLIFVTLIFIWLKDVENSWSLFKNILSLIFFAVPIYLFLLFYYDPDTIQKLRDSFAYLDFIFENVTLPKKIRKQILRTFSDIRGKHILDYGSGVGTLTMHLAEEVGADGKIYAVDLSKRNTRILRKRVNKKKHNHVAVIHDEHQVSRIHPDVVAIDMAFSVGSLGYVQNVKQILNTLNRIMPENGKICFVEYVDYFGFIPNIAWLNDVENIRKVFREAGFAIQIKKEKGIFWNYLFIYGVKTKHDVPFI